MASCTARGSCCRALCRCKHRRHVNGFDLGLKPWSHPRLQGLWPNYVKVVPSIAIAFVSYEQLKEIMGVQLRISS